MEQKIPRRYYFVNASKCFRNSFYCIFHSSNVIGVIFEVFEMRSYRCMLKISWTEKSHERGDHEQDEKNKEIINTVKIKNLSYFVHVKRYPEVYNILYLIL